MGRSGLAAKQISMGNAQARNRIKAADFHYLAKFTAFVTNELVEEYYTNLMDKYFDGKMEKEDFIKTFHLAFPSRPEEKVVKLAEELANKDGKICKFIFSYHGFQVQTFL